MESDPPGGVQRLSSRPPPAPRSSAESVSRQTRGPDTPLHAHHHPVCLVRGVCACCRDERVRKHCLLLGAGWVQTTRRRMLLGGERMNEAAG